MITDSAIDSKVRPRYTTLERGGVELIELPGTGGLESRYPEALVNRFLDEKDMSHWNKDEQSLGSFTQEAFGASTARPAEMNTAWKYEGWLKGQMAEFVGGCISLDEFRVCFPNLVELLAINET